MENLDNLIEESKKDIKHIIIGISIMSLMCMIGIIMLINEKPTIIEKEVIYKGIVINTYNRYINYHIQNGDTLTIDTTYIKIK